MRAFTWGGGQNLSLLNPIAGDSSSGANGINDSGAVAGFSSGPAGMAAVIWLNGAAQAIVPHGAGNNAAVAINNHGTVTGSAGAGHSQRAFFWNAAAGLNFLPPLPGDQSSQAFGISQQDFAAGVSRDSNGATRAVFWDTNGAHNLGILSGGTHSEAFGINASGWVVGSSGSGLGMRAFLWTAADGMRDLNTLIPADSNLVLTSAEAINDAGEIAATGNLNHDLMNDREVNMDRENHSGVTRLFLLVPVQTIAGPTDK
jgi:probable HAF family extracellular repeat protein